MTALRRSLGSSLLLLCSACTDDGREAEATSFASLTFTDPGLDTDTGADTGTTDESGSTGDGDGDPSDTDDDPPFSCEPSPTTPTLALSSWQHPAAGLLAGQTVTLVVQSQNTNKADAPPLTATLVNSQGARTIDPVLPSGGAKPVWQLSLAGLALGDNCVEVRNGANVEYAVKIVGASPSPGVPRGDGVWKITRHHQWTCEEQPTYGNLLQVYVKDEFDSPVPGATVNLRWTDDASFPVPPDAAAQTWEAHGQPKTLTTDANGFAELFTPWGQGIRSPIDAKPSYVVFLVSVAGGASDVATEITTGWWETDEFGCKYCEQEAVNVYGHWSHTIEFKRDPAALQVCEVGTDHAGQAGCSAPHLFHDPLNASCVPVAP